jgi:hypothetical protein
MQYRIGPEGARDLHREHALTARKPRQPYVAPALELVGSCRALTLEQSAGVAFLRALFDVGYWWPDEPY